MTETAVKYDAETLQERILTFRDQKVILDADLAGIYGVATKVLNQAVKRNAERFPPDFLFQLRPQEVADMRSQIVTGSRSQSVTLKRGHNVKYMPYGRVDLFIKTLTDDTEFVPSSIMQSGGTASVPSCPKDVPIHALVASRHRGRPFKFRFLETGSVPSGINQHAL